MPPVNLENLGSEVKIVGGKNGQAKEFASCSNVAGTKRQNTGNGGTGQYYAASNGVTPVQPATPIGLHEKKQAKLYVLTVLKDGEYQELSAEEMQEFIEDYPEIARFWQEPETLQALSLPKEDNILYDSWDQVAKRIIS